MAVDRPAASNRPQAQYSDTSVHPQDSQRDRASSSPFEPLAVGHRDDCRIEHALCADQMRRANSDAPPIDR